MFARTVVNRVWANFMGRGLVDPVDDLRATNPASNEELLAALSKDFVANGYDVKRLIRTIMNSAVYQLSSEANATNQSDNIYYSKHIVRRLQAEVILDAMSRVTGSPTAFPGYPAGTRALQLPDTQVKSEFLASFGRPARNICDAGERSSDRTIALAMKMGLSDRRILEHVFLSAFSRYPTDSERQQLLSQIASAKNHKEALEDIVWAMLTSKEFLFSR
jgi:hypothetical protein